MAGQEETVPDLEAEEASAVSEKSKKNTRKGLFRFSEEGLRSLIVLIVLFLCCVLGFFCRLFSVIRFESIIHEFDPWFNYRSTHHMVTEGFYNFLNWFDSQAWYPLGRIVGGTVYPGLMVTAGSIHYLLHLLNIPVHIREVCVFLAPLFSGLTAIATYFLTSELWNQRAGLLAACFICIAPGYISRSVAGSYDNEGIAIFALQLTYFLWLRALRTGSVFWSGLAALAYLYMVSAWGGYVFIINLIPLHVFVLLLIGMYTPRLYVAYTTFYILGLLFSMQIPFVGFQPVRTSEHMASAGVFVLVQGVAFLQYLKAHLKKAHYNYIFFAGFVLVAAAVFLGVVGLTYLGYIAPWSGRFYSLWDTGYAKIHIPIITSVSEHQPTTWTAFFFDLHVLVCAYPFGTWLCIRKLNDLRVFIILYAIFASYFAGVMIRLMLTLTPVVCVTAAIAFSDTLDNFLNNRVKINADEEQVEEEEGKNDGVDDGKVKKEAKKKSLKAVLKEKKQEKLSNENEEVVTAESSSSSSITVMLVVMLFTMFVIHCTWVTGNAYSSPSVVLASSNSDGSRYILDDFREAYYWLRQNTAEDAKIMSWWDYGYQIAGFSNRTTLVDNNTWNNSHIALVGKAMASNETVAYDIMRSLDVDYVLVIFGGYIGYSGDDINKFLWMVRIAQGEHPGDIKESSYFTPAGEYRIDSSASETMLNSLMYRMSYYRFGELKFDSRMPSGFDRVRDAEIGLKNYKLKKIDEAFTSEHWLVRIYRVKPLENHERSHLKVRQVTPVPKFRSRKTASSKAGSIKNKPVVKPGQRRRRSGSV